MNLSAQEIAAEILTLPEQEQQEVFDFVGFLKVKLARRKTKLFLSDQESQSVQQTLSEKEKDFSPIYKAFEQAGLIGCIETDEQLSTKGDQTWKSATSRGKAK